MITGLTMSANAGCFWGDEEFTRVLIGNNGMSYYTNPDLLEDGKIYAKYPEQDIYSPVPPSAAPGAFRSMPALEVCNIDGDFINNDIYDSYDDQPQTYRDRHESLRLERKRKQQEWKQAYLQTKANEKNARILHEKKTEEGIESILIEIQSERREKNIVLDRIEKSTIENNSVLFGIYDATANLEKLAKEEQATLIRIQASIANLEKLAKEEQATLTKIQAANAYAEKLAKEEQATLTKIQDATEELKRVTLENRGFLKRIIDYLFSDRVIEINKINK